MALALERRKRQRDRDLALDLLGVEVGDGGAVLDPALAVDRPRAEQQRLGEGGLPGPAVTDQGDVADLGGREGLHSTSLDLGGLTGCEVASQKWYADPGWYRDRAHSPTHQQGAGLTVFDGRWRTGVDRGTRPVGDGTRRTGITADHLTGVGLVDRRLLPRSPSAPAAWASASRC